MPRRASALYCSAMGDLDFQTFKQGFSSLIGTGDLLICQTCGAILYELGDSLKLHKQWHENLKK